MKVTFLSFFIIFIINLVLSIQIHLFQCTWYLLCFRFHHTSVLGFTSPSSFSIPHHHSCSFRVRLSDLNFIPINLDSTKFNQTHILKEGLLQQTLFDWHTWIAPLWNKLILTFHTLPPMFVALQYMQRNLHALPRSLHSHFCIKCAFPFGQEYSGIGFEVLKSECSHGFI